MFDSCAQVVKDEKGGVVAPHRLKMSFTTPEEGEEAVLVFELDRDAVNEVTFEVNSIDGSANSDPTNGFVHYRGVAKEAMSILPGERYTSLKIPTYDSGVSDVNKDFWVQVSNIVGAISGDPLLKRVEIQNKHTGILPYISVRSTANVVEGSASRVVFTLDRNAIDNTVFLVSTADGTALAGKDYIKVDREEVHIRKGERTAEYYVYTIEDDEVEGDEFFSIKIVEAVLNCQIGVPDEGIIVIKDKGTDYTDLRLGFSKVTNQNASLGAAFELIVSLHNLSDKVSSGTITIPLTDKFSYGGFVASSSGEVRYHAGSHTLIWENIAPLEQSDSEQLVFKLLPLQVGTHSIVANLESELPNMDSRNNTATVRVNVADLFIPNMVTPNGDGFNDVWHLIDDMETFKAKVRIVNQLSVVVYQSDDYKNDWGAENVSDGTYFYKVELILPSGKSRSYQGVLTVIDKK